MVIDFIKAAAEFMVNDRPDAYTLELATAELDAAMETLRQIDDRPSAMLSFSSYLLVRIYDDGMEEFLLSRKLASVVLFEPEEETIAHSWHPGIDLPDIEDPDLGLDGSEDL